MADLYAVLGGYPERNPPTIYIPIPAKTVQQLEDVKPGQVVHVLLIGTLTQVTKRKPSTAWPGYVGEISVEADKIAVATTENAIQEFLDDVGG